MNRFIRQFQDSEKRAWVTFASRLATVLFVCAIAVHLVGPGLIRSADNLPTQMIRAQTRLIDSLDKSASPVDVVIMGDSTAARALISKQIEAKLVGPNSPYRVVSYAVTYGTLANSYLLLLRHLQKQPPPRCIAIMTSYGAAEKHYGEVFWREMVEPQIFLLDELMLLYDWSAEVDDFPADTHSRLGYYLNLVYYRLLNGFSLDRAQGFLFNPLKRKSAELLFRRTLSEQGSFPFPKSYRFRPPNPEFHLYLKEKYRIEPMVDLILKKIAGLKTSNVVLFSPPMAATYYSGPVQQWTKDYAQHMKILLGQNQNVHISMDPLTLPDADFLDPTHVFAEGAALLQQSYVDVIQRCLGSR